MKKAAKTLDRAFPNTPESVRTAIEEGFRRGEVRAALRHRIVRTFSIAACLLVLFALSALGVSRLTEPKPDLYATSKPLQGKPAQLTATPEATPICSTVKPTVTPTCSTTTPTVTASPMPTPTATPTPMPTTTTTPTEAPEITAEAEVKPLPTPMDEAVTIDEGRLCFFTKGGKYYHYDEHCQGMLNARAADEAVALENGKIPCPVCALSAEVYAADGSPYYHKNSVCIGISSMHESLTEPEACERGLKLCPYCMSDAARETFVFMNLSGKYIHTQEHCSGMLGAERMTLAQACAIGADKELCPACCEDLIEWSDEARVELIEFDVGDAFKSVRVEMQGETAVE